MSDYIKAVTGEELKELIGSGKKVVCDFWATWCGPCRMLAPVMEEVAEEFQGRAEFVKLDIDENEQLAMSYGVMSIPDVYVFENGAVKDHHLGYAPKEAMTEFLKKNV
ncbi:MAG: thioredoxin [Candidatus Gallimonas sp.]